MAKTKLFRTLTDNLQTILPKKIFHEISPQPFSQGFLLILKFSEHFPKTDREFSEKTVHEFYQKHFPEFHNFRKFFENFETTLINVHFQFCLAVESIGQEGAILPDANQIAVKQGKMSRHIIIRQYWYFFIFKDLLDRLFSRASILRTLFNF